MNLEKIIILDPFNPIRFPSVNGRVIQKCEASSYKSLHSNLKCNYVEFAENLSIKFNGEIDSSIAEFWNEIDPSMVRKRKAQATSATLKSQKNFEVRQNFIDS